MKGSTEMVREVRSLAKRHPRAVERALYKFGSIEMKEMKRRTPVDTGTLRDSGFVEKPVWVSQGEIQMALGFGGAAESYAIYVHEDMEAFHRVGQAKFAKSVLDESERYFPQRIAADVKAEMGYSE